MTRPLRLALAFALTITGVLTMVAAEPHVDALDSTPWRIPDPPRRCTTSEADSGDVADCVLIAYPDPSTTGWGAPPAPGVGAGWNWLGYTYNGSPALAGWESTYIVDNTDPVAGFRAGYLETHRYAQPLFEGFLNEISANGYRVWGVSGYSFRCTSGNGGWSCPSGDPDDLSNHAWGLAIDMNAGTNPIRRYSSINGATACQTPMQTDMPKWVIETAERWGLYWGGYGWNSGCPTDDTWRTSVYRDPPHFEFRGTPGQALAIAEFNQANDPRRRCWDTVSDQGEPVEQCNLTGVPEAGWRLPVAIDVPPGAAAALVNLTATGSSERGHLTTESCGPAPEQRGTSSVNFGADETAAAMVIAPLDGGRFCIYRSTDVHSLVDVVGFFTDTGDRLWYEPLAGQRMLDSRRDPTCGDEICETEPVPTGDQRAVPVDDSAARLVNLTVTEAADRGHARLGPCETVADGQFSHINYVAQRSRANLGLLPGDAVPCVWTRSESHVIVDEIGRLDAAEGLGWGIAPAERILDTRRCTETWCDGRPIGHVPYPIAVDTTAPAIAITVTVTDADSPGYAWVGGDCSTVAETKPSTSTVNYVPGAATANMTIVTPVDGQICIYVRADAHVVIDRQAELVAEHTVGLRPVDSFRAHDSRVVDAGENDDS